MEKIRILIIEDNRLLREGLTKVLMKEPDFEVIKALQPDENMPSKTQLSDIDVVLLDMDLQSFDSLEVVELIKKHDQKVNVILMGIFATQSEVLEFVECGVKGFILKDATVFEFFSTIRAVASDEKVLPAYLTESLFAQIVEKSLEDPCAEDLINDSVRITQREKDVIELIAEGLSNKEIAEKLYLSPYTIKSHVHNILEKLTLNSRLQISKYARDNEQADV